MCWLCPSSRLAGAGSSSLPRTGGKVGGQEWVIRRGTEVPGLRASPTAPSRRAFWVASQRGSKGTAQLRLPRSPRPWSAPLGARFVTSAVVPPQAGAALSCRWDPQDPSSLPQPGPFLRTPFLAEHPSTALLSLQICIFQRLEKFWWVWFFFFLV